MTKKIISLLLALTLVLGFASAVNAEDIITVTLDGTVLTFDQNPVIIDGRTLVPLRGIFEAMGATVDWNEETRCVTATKGETTVLLTIGDNTIYRNGEAVALDVPAQIVNSRTLVPARAVSESFGARVDWNGETRNVIISTDEVLNAAIANFENAGEIVINMNMNVSYEGIPVVMNMDMGIDSANQKYFISYVLDMILAKTQVTMVSGEGKTYIDENGTVTVSEEEMENPLSAIGNDDVFVLESETESEKIYSVNYANEDGTFTKIKFYVDKQSLTFTKLVYPKEILTQQGIQTENDMLGTIEYNTGETMELWNKYNK